MIIDKEEWAALIVMIAELKHLLKDASFDHHEQRQKQRELLGDG